MRVEVFKLTHDNWYPSHYLKGWHQGVENQMLVKVSFMSLSDGQWRVCCWGNDDMGLERDFATEIEAHTVFLQIIGWESVSQHRLKSELGFYPA